MSNKARFDKNPKETPKFPKEMIITKIEIKKLMPKSNSKKKVKAKSVSEHSKHLSEDRASEILPPSNPWIAL
jgi:hypothetical protein